MPAAAIAAARGDMELGKQRPLVSFRFVETSTKLPMPRLLAVLMGV